MKKICSILLIIALSSTLAACGGGSRSSSATSPSGGYLTGSRASSAPETASESPVDAAATELSAEENWALIADYFRANFPQPLMTVRADVNRDGLDDCVFVDTLTDEWARFGYVLTVKNGEVQKYLVKEGGETHGQGFFDWFLSPNEQGDAYLIEYNTSMWQGMGTLTMLRYYLDENGEKVILDEYTVGDKPEDNDEKGVIKDSVFKEFYVEGAKWLHRKYILHIAGTWGNGNWSDLEMLDPQIPAIAFADEDEEPEEERRNITGNGIIDVYFTDTDHPIKMIDGAYEILLPKSWSGRYVANIEKTPGTQEETVDFFCKACYDTDPRSGWLCSVYFANFVEVTANDAASPGSEWRQLGEWSGGDVYLLLPTDVPVTSKAPALLQEYAVMAGEVKNITFITKPVEKKVTQANAQIDDIIIFGSYEQDGNLSNGSEAIEWVVLDKEDDRLLVISRYCLEYMQYSERYPQDGMLTWENCTVRNWLNNDFSSTAFSNKERAMIPSVTISTKDNSLMRTKGGSDTVDQIFLLSTEEVAKYFSSDEERCPGATEYIAGRANAVKWWTRTPGRSQAFAALVSPNSVVFSSGLDYNGDGAKSLYAIRPAMWISTTP